VLQRLTRADPALLAIVVEGFLSRLSFGLISFALPLYAYQRFGLSLTEIGVLLSFNLMVAIALKPFMGALADRIGMKPSFSAAIAIRSVVSLLLALATLPWQLFAIRGVHGVSISLRDPAAGVLLAEAGGKKAVASAFAWYQTAKSVAGAVGKASAGVLLTLTASNFSLVFLIAFVLSALPIFVVARYVQERPVDEEQLDQVGEAVALDEERVTDARVMGGPSTAGPAVLPYAGLGFLISGTAYMLANLFPIFAVEYAGLNEAQTGLVYLISIAAMLCGPVFGWLSDNVSRRLVLSLRGAANVVSSVVYLVAPNFAGVAAGRAVDDLGKAAFRPAWGALMAHVAGFDRRRRARTMGSLSAGEDAGEVAGPILAGFLWSTWGVPALLGARIGLAAVTEVYALALSRSLGKPGGVRRRQQQYSAMDLTPPEIQYQPLKTRGRGGYDREDVDKLLERVAASYEQVWRERDELRARVSELEEKGGSSRDSEHVLNEILVSAQRAADQVLADARQEAERLATDAQQQAKTAAEHELGDLRAEIERLRSLERYIYSGLRARLEEGLKLIEDGRPAEEAPSSQPLAEVQSAGAEDRDG
jgi:DivIVA domain-containing protein